jgi:IMP cyclohydrolase
MHPVLGQPEHRLQDFAQDADRPGFFRVKEFFVAVGFFRFKHFFHQNLSIGAGALILSQPSQANKAASLFLTIGLPYAINTNRNRGHMEIRELNLASVMPYPGRLIIIGGEPRADKVVVAYAVTGRSPASQARRLTFEGSAVWTEPLDEETLRKGNPDLLIYRAIAIDRRIAVSNGRQTDDIARALKQAGEEEPPADILRRSLEGWTYEPDSPHFTPRISGCVMVGGAAAMSIISRREDDVRSASFFSWSVEPGKGRMIATYAGREDTPLPPFAGEPIEVSTREASAQETAEAVYKALTPQDLAKDYRVAVACISALRSNLRNYDVHIINRREG